MLIHVPNSSKMSVGGGWTFLRNFKKGIAPLGGRLVDDWREADVLFIVGATMTERSVVEAAKAAGKPVIFRVDNIPKDSNNRGTAISRMRDFSKLADVVVYQSRWAQEYAGFLCGPGNVVYNGVDTDIFNPSGERLGKSGKVWLYVRSGRDENKRASEAFHRYHMAWRDDRSLQLWIVGRWGDESIAYNFDFFSGEPVEYMGVIEDPKEMAKLMRSADALLWPAFADAAPNTVLEARACGLPVKFINDIGGSREMLHPELDIGLDRMAREYMGIFKIATEEKIIDVET